MKSFKKFLIVIFALILMLPLFGCDKSSSNQDANQSESSDSAKDSKDGKADSSEYIFPESDKTLLTESQLNDLPLKTLELGRNEIFARHGYVFKMEELKKYFSQKSWYKANDSFNSEKDLSATETKNISLIKSIEDKKTNKKTEENNSGNTNGNASAKIYGKIKQVSTENGTKYITIDKVEWLTYDDIQNRQDVKDYLVKQYGSIPSEIENDYFIYDPDSNVTKLQFNNNATITNWKFDDTSIKTFNISFEDLQSNTKQNDMQPQSGIYCISVQNNNITKLEKMYQP